MAFVSAAPDRVIAIGAGGLLLALALAVAPVARAPTPGPSAPQPARAISSQPPARQLAWTMAPGEGLAGALARAGVAPSNAAAASRALADDFDVVNPHPGERLRLSLEPHRGGARLIGLRLQAPDGAMVSLARVGSRFVADRVPAPAPTQAPVEAVRGVVDGSLFLSLAGAGLAPDEAVAITRLFGRQLDLARDIESGDRFTLLFEGPEDRAGAGGLLYARIQTRAGARRLFRFNRADGAVDWLPDSGAARPALLRTPVDGARITSPFGMRLHPILGYSRMHQGIDFAAPIGSPVLAAGDGVVEEARWRGGYGRWLEIRHGPELETGYAHLLAWAGGIAPGAQVRQGEVVGFVGRSGLATGPHLHFEVRLAGRPIDPRAAAGLAAALDRSEAADFQAQRARILRLAETMDAV